MEHSLGLEGIQSFLIVFSRLVGLISAMPITSQPEVPGNVRVLIAMGLALCLTSTLYPLLGIKDNLEILPLTLVCLRELLIGFALGMIARIIMIILDFVGSIIAFTSGLTVAMSFNPAQGAQSFTPSIFVTLMGTVILLSLDLHHYIIQGLIHSYGLMMNTDLTKLSDLTQTTLESVKLMFQVGLQLSYPFIIMGIVYQLAMGLVNRIVPKMQVFFVGMPLQTLVALTVFTSIMNVLPYVFAKEFEALFKSLLHMD